jgi:hypothetical protein
MIIFLAFFVPLISILFALLFSAFIPRDERPYGISPRDVFSLVLRGPLRPEISDFESSELNRATMRPRVD